MDLPHDFVEDNGVKGGLALAALPQHDENPSDADVVQKAAKKGVFWILSRA